jgi:hypothetical protein
MGLQSFLGFKGKKETGASNERIKANELINAFRTTGFNATETTNSSERLKIDQEGVDRILEQLLSGQQGLAGIFAEEQGAGLYDSTVAAQAAGDLAAKVVGEIAALTAERVSTSTKDTEGEEEESAQERKTSESLKNANFKKSTKELDVNFKLGSGGLSGLLTGE